MASQNNVLGEILERCETGEPQAQYQLYNMYSKGMLDVAWQILKQREDAEDVLQDAFVKMFDKLESLKDPVAFTGWFKRIVANNSINYIKKRNKVHLTEVSPNLKDLADEMDVQHAPRYTVDGVKQAIAQLPEGYRIVVSLFLFDGYSHREIAQILGITESTSKSQYHRGRKKLQRILKQAG